MKLLLLLGFALSVSAYAVPTFPPTMQQMQCVYELVEKMYEENSGLESWNNEFKQSYKYIVANLQRCESLSGNEKTKCLEHLQNNSYDKYNHLEYMLPENLKPQFKNIFTNCFESHLFTSEYYYDIVFPITAKQIQCATNVVIKMVAEHPNYLQWSQELKSALKGFQEQAKKCEAMNVTEEKKECYDKLNALVKTEYNRLMKVLGEDVKNYIEEFSKCFQK